MKVVIDFFKLIKGDGKSIGIYNVGYNVVVNLAKVYKNTDVELCIICNSINRSDFDGIDINIVEITQLNPKNKVHCLYWELFAVNKWLNSLKADVVLFPRGFIPFCCNAKSIALVHDMIPFYYNEHYYGYFDIFENLYIMSRLKYSVKKSSKVITVSNFSKNEILKYTNVDEHKISVIYNGIERININDYKNENKDYIFAMTSRLPHKNAIGIIKCYEEYCKIVKNPLKLLIVGVEKFDIDYCSCLPKEVLKNIEFYRYITSNNDLYLLIRNAKLFLFLSYIEGFGLPPIEAMQLEIPVVCSDRSSLPEIVADAAILVNPDDYKNVANQIVKCLNDNHFRFEMIKKGNRNVKRFDWEKQATKYKTVIDNCFHNINEFLDDSL